MRALAFPTVSLLTVLITSPVSAGIIIDQSPQTVGGPFQTGGLANTFDNQYLGDRFSWSGGDLTGASIFSNTGLGNVGDSVRVVILNDGGPGETPVIDITSTIDVIDSQFSLLTAWNRKHTSFAPTFLAAGNYYFYMTGASAGINIGQAYGRFDDLVIYEGRDGLPDLETRLDNFGDLYFQIEGNASALVPEPSSLSCWSLLALFGAMLRRRK